MHDSDGLAVLTGSGEWIWRPLVNPSTLLVTSFSLKNPQGFGLMQRDLDFPHYQDLEAHYHLRPSVWVTPTSRWGEGRVELVQIPSDKEINDNIVAYWVPARLPELGEPLPFFYSMKWHFPNRTTQPEGRVTATRSSAGKDKQQKRFLVEFTGPKLEALPPETPIQGVVTLDGNAVLEEQQIQKISDTGGWRLVFQVRLERKGTLERVLPETKDVRPIEMRAFLRQGDTVLTETWSYVYRP